MRQSVCLLPPMHIACGAREWDAAFVQTPKRHDIDGLLHAHAFFARRIEGTGHDFMLM
jgi:hypothetical protein